MVKGILVVLISLCISYGVCGMSYKKLYDIRNTIYDIRLFTSLLCDAVNDLRVPFRDRSGPMTPHVIGDRNRFGGERSNAQDTKEVPSPHNAY